MRFRNQYFIIITIVVVVYALGFYIANNQEPLDITYPSEDTILNNDDFLVSFPKGELEIGSSSWEKVEQVLPEGKILGMSTIYSPKNIDCLLTFTEDENMLCKLHITDPSIVTNRNVKIGDQFSVVIDAYGNNYASVSKKGNKTDFDAVYGADNSNSIVFQVRDNKVSKIILQKDPILN